MTYIRNSSEFAQYETHTKLFDSRFDQPTSKDVCDEKEQGDSKLLFSTCNNFKWWNRCGRVRKISREIYIHSSSNWSYSLHAFVLFWLYFRSLWKTYQIVLSLNFSSWHSQRMIRFVIFYKLDCEHVLCHIHKKNYFPSIVTRVFFHWS